MTDEPLKLFYAQAFMCPSCDKIHMQWYAEDQATIIATCQMTPDHFLNFAAYFTGLALTVLGMGGITILPVAAGAPMTPGEMDSGDQTKH